MRCPNSYDPAAPVPAVSTRWVWEIDSPHARCLIEVVEAKWNSEEWWVKVRTLGGYESHWVDLGRFFEAVTPIGATPRRAWTTHVVQMGIEWSTGDKQG